MDLDLTGKVALVTGSTRGIGLATALGLARMGAQVIVNGRTEPPVAEAIAKIKGAAPAAKAQSAVFDLGTAEGCAALIARFPAVASTSPSPSSTSPMRTGSGCSR
jgi:NAD(P)-dependent dehydrogenase (short-subunit alcohol dehydrogenase family)